MAMPFDFEIEQMMMKGSTHRGTEFTREDKSIVDKMIGGSVTTIDANLIEKMIDGSIETNNARIVEQMVAGSHRCQDEEPSTDFCLPSLNSSSRSKTNGDFKESKATEYRQVHGGASRRVHVDDFKSSDEKGHHEVPVVNVASFQALQHPTISAAAMPKDDRTDHDNMGVKDPQHIHVAKWELRGGELFESIDMKKRPSVSNPETRRNSPPPSKARFSRHTLPAKPHAVSVSSSQLDDRFDTNQRTSQGKRESAGAEGRGREGRASFPSYELPSDIDILSKMLGGSVNKR